MRKLLCLALLFPAAGLAQISLDANAGTVNSGDVISVSVFPSAGSYVLVWAMAGWAAQSSAPTCSCTGATCNFTILANVNYDPGAGRMYLYGMPNAPSGITGITCTFQSWAGHSVQVVSFTGVASADPMDGAVLVSEWQSGSTWQTQQKTTQCSETVIVAAGGIVSPQPNISVGGPSSGWSGLATVYDTNYIQSATFGSYRIAFSAGSYQDTRTISGTFDNWHSIIVALKKNGTNCGGAVSRRRIIE